MDAGHQCGSTRRASGSVGCGRLAQARVGLWVVLLVWRDELARALGQRVPHKSIPATNACVLAFHCGRRTSRRSAGHQTQQPPSRRLFPELAFLFFALHCHFRFSCRRDAFARRPSNFHFQSFLFFPLFSFFLPTIVPTALCRTCIAHRASQAKWLPTGIG